MNKTNETKHTPGPWVVAEGDSNGQAVVRNADIEIATCWHHCVDGIEREMRANARLIAAAPELLAALDDLAEMCQQSRKYIVLSDDGGMDAYNSTAEAILAARAAIAKAKGEACK